MTLPVVLLHGLARTSADWTALVERLEPDRRCFTPDLAEMRVTDRAPDTKAMVETIKSVLDAAHVTRAHWVGSSAGGHLALAALDLVPDRIASLVLIGALPWRSQLASITVPTKLLFGERDLPTGLPLDAEIIPGAGHLAQIDDPKAVAEALTAFWTSV